MILMWSATLMIEQIKMAFTSSAIDLNMRRLAVETKQFTLPSKYSNSCTAIHETIYIFYGPELCYKPLDFLRE